jgi:nitrate reductase beta subunit
LTTQFSKGTKRVAVGSIHEIDKLASQLEWGTLKAGILARDVKKEESKVNMNQMAMRIQQNVAILLIFYLKKVADHGVSCINAFYETSLGACIVVSASISCSRKSHQAK